MEEGENLIDALAREAREESGANITVEKLVGITSNTGKYEGYNNVGIVPTKVVFDFFCKYVDGELCESDETSEPMWIPKDEILNHFQNQGMRERINTYLHFDGNVQYSDITTKPEFNLKLKRSI